MLFCCGLFLDWFVRMRVWCWLMFWVYFYCCGFVCCLVLVVDFVFGGVCISGGVICFVGFWVLFL